MTVYELPTDLPFPSTTAAVITSKGWRCPH